MNRIVLLFLLASAAALPAFTQCGTQVISGYSTPSSMGWDSVNVVGQNFPSNLAGAVAAGRQLWNNSTCNTNAIAFPFFGSINGQYTVTVSWNPGMRPDGACGDFNPNTRQVTIYAQTTFNGKTVNCLGHNQDAIAQAIAHELGHFLGLDNTPSYCWGGMMMSPFHYDYNTGEFIPKSPTEAECATANQINVTYNEQHPIPPPDDDPYCDSYCWTTCTNGQCPAGNPWCPILVDVENDGIRLTGLGDPVSFDIDADGDLDIISWTDRSDGILALDRNSNGTIDDGGELFGNATHLADGSLAPNGYVALAELDSFITGGNQDGTITASDEAFASLRLWKDLNHDGISQQVELATLSAKGVVRIDLDYKTSHRRDRYGNEFRFLGKAMKENPQGIANPIQTWDVFFQVAH